jgi:hypothetical protein
MSKINFPTGEVPVLVHPTDGTCSVAARGKGSAARSKAQGRGRKGEIVTDLITSAPVECSGYTLSVASCRIKPNWDYLGTISCQDTLYAIADYVEAAPPRRHVYLLRRAPEHQIVRDWHRYDSVEVLQG